MRLLAAAIAVVLIVAITPFDADANFEGEGTNLFEAAVVISTLDQPPNVRADYSFCVSRWIPGYAYYDSTIDDVVVVPGYPIPCQWKVECMSYRVDDIDLDPVFAEFNSPFPAPFFDLYSVLEAGFVLVLSFCRDLNSGQMLHTGAGTPSELTAYGVRSYTLPEVATEVTAPDATRLALWSAIPEPTIEIEGAPPVDQNTWVQASTWFWIEEIETPLVAVSINAADTVRLAVRANVTEIAWAFGDGTTLVCAEDRLVVWDPSLHPYDDSDVGCTHIYKKVANAGFNVVATVLFEGESVLQSKAAASAPWPAPVWEPYAQSRQVPGDLLVQVFEIASRN